jgi:hypothetical protein
MSEKIMCDNLILDLKSSREGIENLKKTYSTDLKFVCDLNCLLEFIDANLLELSPRLPILSSPSLNGITDDLPPPPPYMPALSLPPPSTDTKK